MKRGEKDLRGKKRRRTHHNVKKISSCLKLSISGAHNGYLEFICNWDVGPVMTILLMCSYTQASTSDHLYGRMYSFGKPQQWPLSFEKLITVRTSSTNCSHQKANFQQGCIDMKVKLRNLTNIFKPGEISSSPPAFDITVAFLCAIPHLRRPPITHIELSELPNLIHQGC